MPPKGKAKGKGKKGAKKARKSSKHSVVGRYFYESQIAELNQTLAALRTKVIEVEDENNELVKTKEDLIQDEKDIIAYLNRTTNEQINDFNRLKSDCDTVEKERVKSGEDFEAQKAQMMQNHHEVEEQLLADLKLTVGKMHALEEFRLLRDTLMRKYEELETELEDQKMRHKREIYEVERKFIISDDKLKKEMDAKLKWLIEEFQAVTDLRVAATTQRVIKENIALNNMIETKLHKMKKLYEKHNKLHSHDGVMKLMSEITEYEATAMANHSRLLREEIGWLVKEYSKMQNQIKHAKLSEPTILAYQKKTKEFHDEIAECDTKELILQQNLHEFRCAREEIIANLRFERNRNEELKEMLKEVARMLQLADVSDDVYTLFDQSPEDDSGTPSKSSVLYSIFEFLKQVRDWNRRPKEVEFLEDRNDIYMQGKVGLVPREILLKGMIPTMEEKNEQMDGSSIMLISEKSWELVEEEEVEEEPEVEEVTEGALVELVEQETQTEDSQSDSK